MRSAYCFKINFLATIGSRYNRMASDTPHATKHIPYFEFATWDQFYQSRPRNCSLIAVEVNGKQDLTDFCHQKREVFVLGGEDRILPDSIISDCDYSIRMDTMTCLNLAVCGSILLYDRSLKLKKK